MVENIVKLFLLTNNQNKIAYLSLKRSAATVRRHSLPVDICICDNYDSFRHQLKTSLFHTANDIGPTAIVPPRIAYYIRSGVEFCLELQKAYFTGALELFSESWRFSFSSTVISLENCRSTLQCVTRPAQLQFVIQHFYRLAWCMLLWVLQVTVGEGASLLEFMVQLYCVVNVAAFPCGQLVAVE